MVKTLTNGFSRVKSSVLSSLTPGMRAIVIVLTMLQWSGRGEAETTSGDVPFFEAADKRIEQIRKRDVIIEVVDGRSHPVPGASIEVRQTRNLFGFGSALRADDQNLGNSKYREAFKSLFEWMIDEGSLGWYSAEQSRDQEDYFVPDRAVDWALKNDIKIMGPPIFWAGELQPWQQALRRDDLKHEMDERLASLLNRYRGKFEFWSLENEMLIYDDFVSELGPEIRPWVFQQARRIDPDAKLMVNENDIIAGSDSEKIERYKSLVRDLQSHGATIDAIGIQGHFVVEKAIDPVEVYRRLDRMAELDLPIWITEFDFGTWDERRRADGLEAVYRAAFSHPMVDGILMWGFYENAHWRPQYLPQYGPAHIVDEDWTLNAAGRRYVELRDSWTTRSRGKTNGQGIYRFRGFHGTYEIKIRPRDGMAETVTIDVPKGSRAQHIVHKLHFVRKMQDGNGHQK